MIRLVFADMWHSRSVWLGVFMVTACTGIAVSVPVALVATALTTDGLAALALLSLASTDIAVTGIAAAVVTSGVLRQTVAVRARDIAVWIVLGATALRVRGAVTVQVQAVAAVGAVAGALAGTALAPLAVTLGLTGATGLGEVSVAPWSIGQAALTVIVVMLFALPAAIAAGGRAAHTPPLRSISDIDESSASARPWRRAALAACLGLVGVSMLAGLPSAGSEPTQLLLIGPVAIGAVATLGATVLAPLLRLWTWPWRSQALVFALARQSASSAARRNDSVLSSAVLAIGIPAGLLGGAEAVATPGAVAGAGPAAAVVLLAGGAAFLASVASGVGIGMAARLRAREQTQLQSAGATLSVVLVAAAVEALMLLFTGALAVVLTLTVVGAAESLLLGRFVLPLGIPILAFSTAVTGVILLTAALAPVLVTAPRPIAARLALG